MAGDHDPLRRPLVRRSTTEPRICFGGSAAVSSFAASAVPVAARRLHLCHGVATRRT